MNQVSVRAVNLADIETRVETALCGVAPRADDRPNFRDRQCDRSWGPFANRNRACGYRRHGGEPFFASFGVSGEKLFQGGPHEPRRPA